MPKPPKIDLDDLTPAQRRELGIRKPRQQALVQEDIRSYAIAALYPLRDLTRNERRRVLAQMAKMNNV